MNESELERQLLRLRPRAPSPELEGRIAAELGAPAPVRPQVPAAGVLGRPVEPSWTRFLPNLGWAAAGLAAGVVLVVSLQQGTSQTGSPAPAAAVAQHTPAREEDEALFEPEESAREVVSSDAPEILYDAENEPAQVVRYSSLERHTWTNRVTGARVEIEMPREDVLFLPVSYQ
jgi:hypothetical protein